MWIRTSDGRGLVNPNGGITIVARWTSISPKEKKAVIAVSMLSCITGEYTISLGEHEFKLKGQSDKELKNEAEGICKKIISLLWDFLKQGKDFDMNEVFKMVLKSFLVEKNSNTS